MAEVQLKRLTVNAQKSVAAGEISPMRKQRSQRTRGPGSNRGGLRKGRVLSERGTVRAEDGIHTVNWGERAPEQTTVGSRMRLRCDQGEGLSWQIWVPILNEACWWPLIPAPSPVSMVTAVRCWRRDSYRYLALKKSTYSGLTKYFPMYFIQEALPNA